MLKTPHKNSFWLLVTLLLVACVTVLTVWWANRSVAIATSRLEDAEMRAKALARELEVRGRYEKTVVGTKPSQSNGDRIMIAEQACQPLAQIGIFADDTTIIPSVLEALKKRDPRITSADLEPMTNAIIYSDSAVFKDNKDGVPGVVIRLADGGIARLSPSDVPMSRFNRIALTHSYQEKNREKLCQLETARPELSDCLPTAVTLLNHGIYMGSYVSNCSKIFGLD